MNQNTVQKRIFIDKELCDGCLNCNIACMNAHREGAEDVYSLNLSSPLNETRNFIKKDAAGNYKPIFCRHCDKPECVATCMSGALQKDPETGLVLYNRDVCGACFMCVMNCPFGVPKPDRATKSYVVKCDFCIGKADQSGPSCVAACPKKAITVREVRRK
ncbi:MAG: 4Fe-4S dicluster domain-containing protein [Clostridiales bacterium]|jgi:carbon-monoxide dehydrogenase iron sulfur subunit|nr:4Fe-4S dicluster domain-containing protein [Clostridiales bacterium]